MNLTTRKNEILMAYLFLVPVFLFYLIFWFIPIAFSFFLSFTEWSGFDLSLIKWVGLANYKVILSKGSPFINPILINTFAYAFGSVFISFISALIIAFMITRLRFESVWRTFYFLPMVTTVVAIGNIWRFMYSTNYGLINALLNKLGLPQVAFLSNPKTALPSIIVVAGWAGIGGGVLILSAGLKAIPDVYYEAAIIDGANTFQNFLYITLPLLKPSILFVLITGLINGLQSFTLILVMTTTGLGGVAGGPANATNVAALEMYQQAFLFGSWGKATAMSFVLFIIVFIITLIQLRIFRKGGIEIE
ncbi:carbohydrate ABC transporter permease [Caldanaerobacter subterraneus]|uniref:Sugar ABC transporter permease n=1 Tax=Caldanaerobacter subterraneus TaxID=911092 RepID=A0A7Y2L9H2_9THEO|nr:sugar ABC transporter permease [Caldanaerobacter subterraneus]NNG66856.1 sugar ABC transporter permease [Caldanaerobacter subterraneus]